MPDIGYLKYKIERVEGVCILGRHHNNVNVRTDKMLDEDYPFEKSAPNSWTVQKLIRNRISRIFPGYKIFIHHRGKIANGHIKLINQRKKSEIQDPFLKNLFRSKKRIKNA
jgi:hypothetical protein